MKYLQTKRIYGMSDNEMLSIIRRLIRYLQEDLPALSKYGINQSKLDSLKAICQSVEYLSDDEYFRLNIIETTSDVKEAVTTLKDAISMIVGLSRACFGAKSPFAKNLELSDYSKFPFDKLILSAKAAIPLLESNLETLKEVGLTAEIIQDFSDKIKSAEEAKLAQKKQKEDRINATHDRIKLLNEAYEQVMMCANIAKTVFAKSDPKRASYYSLSRYRKMKREKEEDAGEDENN